MTTQTIVLQPGDTLTVLGGQGTPPPVVIPPPVVTPPPVIVPGNVKLLQWDWTHPQRQYSESVGGFGPDDIIAVQFTTGSVPTVGSLPRATGAEYRGPPLPRDACFSLLPGDFAHPISGPFGGGVLVGQSITLVFALQTADMYYPTLKLNTTYYLNVRNRDGQSGDMFFDLVGTAGL
jgi:hypothetical protein